MNNIADYVKTNNFKTLDQIFEETIQVAGLSKNDAAKASRGKFSPKEKESLLTIMWCEKVIEEYISIKGAVCKGEIKFVGSKFLDVDMWQFNQYILERKIKGYGDIKENLLEKNIFSEKISTLLANLDSSRSLTYAEITKPQHIIWYAGSNRKDLTKANNYLASLMETYPTLAPRILKTTHSTKIIESHNIVEKPLSNRLTNEKQAEIISEERKDSTSTVEKFMEKYTLNSKSYAGITLIAEEKLERELIIKGITEEVTRKEILRLFIRNYKLSETFKVPGSNKYNGLMITNFALTYTQMKPEERKEFLSDLYNAFSIK